MTIIGGVEVGDNHFNFEEYMKCELLDSPFEGILVIDLKGTIRFCNQFFLRILGLNEEEIIGREIGSVIPGCRLYSTIGQNCSSWGEILRINSREMVISRYPLKFNNEIQGAVLKTIFPDMVIAKEVAAKLTNSYCNVNHFRSLYTCMDIIGESEPMLLAKKLARRAARSTSNLIITGESGTGKSIMAEAIHNRSVRRDAPFVKVNCAAIPENLLESELFGYEEGAFTGASRRGKIGKFELANGGTLFLDEIGDMSLHMQAKVLQAIQDKRIERLGGTRSIDLDIRIISATNKDLEKMVAENKFREDLYYRLKVLEIRMPSLREMPEDIPRFIKGLLNKINKRLGSDAIGLTEESIRILQEYSWPGNVRQLENFLEQAVNYSDEAIIDITKLPISLEEDYNEDLNNYSIETFNAKDNLGSDHLKPKDLNETLLEIERNIIIETIKRCNGNKSKAAEALNIHRSVLYKKLKRLNIEM